MRRILGFFIFTVLLLVGASIFLLVSTVSDRGSGDANEPTILAESGGGVDRPDNAVEISIIYAPEEELYIVDAIRDFNQSYADGVNPLTGNSLASDERPHLRGRAARVHRVQSIRASSTR